MFLSLELPGQGVERRAPIFVLRISLQKSQNAGDTMQEPPPLPGYGTVVPALSSLGVTASVQHPRESPAVGRNEHSR